MWITHIQAPSPLTTPKLSIKPTGTSKDIMVGSFPEEIPKRPLWVLEPGLGILRLGTPGSYVQKHVQKRGRQAPGGHEDSRWLWGHTAPCRRIGPENQIRACTAWSPKQRSLLPWLSKTYLLSWVYLHIIPSAILKNRVFTYSLQGNSVSSINVLQGRLSFCKIKYGYHY